MKRRILLVDDEVAVLLTLKTVLEISGFDVDTATSAREGKSRIKHREYEMVITDMRMEGERAGEEVIEAAKAAPYQPAIALLTAFPVDDEALDNMGADQMLVKPMHTRQLLQQLEALFAKRHGSADTANAKSSEDDKESADEAGKPAKKATAAKKTAAAKVSAAKPAAKKAAAKKSAAKKAVVS
jgi:DNA-binding response OmpR family regulator